MDKSAAVQVEEKCHKNIGQVHTYVAQWSWHTNTSHCTRAACVNYVWNVYNFAWIAVNVCSVGQGESGKEFPLAKKICTFAPFRHQTWTTHALLPCLSHSVDPPHCLLLCSGVQCWLTQYNMCGLGDVESIGTNVQGKEENADTVQGLESSKALLHQADWQEGKDHKQKDDC